MNSTVSGTVHFLHFSRFRPAPATDGGPAGLERSAPTGRPKPSGGPAPEQAGGGRNRLQRFNTVETLQRIEEELYIYIYLYYY